jgi:Enoyl-(Acyl carrier protein) reductase
MVDRTALHKAGLEPSVGIACWKGDLFRLSRVADPSSPVLRIDHARYINLNWIAPGYYDMQAPLSTRNDPVRAPQILDRIPCGRWWQPDEIGGLCVFLASDASNYMHGSIIPIDGGWLAR